MSKLVGFARLMRPINCLMMGFAVIVGAALASPHNLSVFWQNLVYGFVTGFMLTGASMSFNDYYDREIDAINEPKRPVPSGLVKPSEAVAFASVLTVAGLVTAYLTNLPCLLLAAFSWVVFFTYTTVGKRSGLPGNFLVSLCVSIPFIYGSLVVAGVSEANVLVFASMVFLSNTGREVTKGIVDVEGDKTRNVKTLAVRYGAKTAAFSAASFYVFAVALSSIPWVLGIVSFWFVPLVAVTDVGLVASSVVLVWNHSRENARRVKNAALLWFAIGLIAFIVGALIR
jgi:geranylgeranylglycerol-phosphate geranylgeranyltransferase